MRFDYQLPPGLILLWYQRLLELRYAKTLVWGGAILIALLYSVNNFFTEERTVLNNNVNNNIIKEPLEVTPQPITVTESQTTTQLNDDIIKQITVGAGDTLSKIFAEIGLQHNLIAKLIAAHPSAENHLSNLYPGQQFRFVFSADNQLKEIQLSISNTKYLNIRSVEKGFKFYYEDRQITKKMTFASNVIKDSLFGAAQAVGLHDKIIMQLAEIFGWDIDFALDLRENDRFRVLFEEEYIDNERIDIGNILAAEFINQGKKHIAIRFTDDAGNSGFYTPEGYSLQKAFLRTPVKFTRISSHFSQGRRHPVLHRIRAHKGVDYAAPHGTPVKASGDGRIHFIGVRGDYGNVIELKHGKRYSTLYAHLSGFARNLKQGQTVKQGQVIGYVGKSGLATGEHLHYEFRVDNIHRNPLTVHLPKSSPVHEMHKQKFFYHAKNMLEIMDAQDNTKLS